MSDHPDHLCRALLAAGELAEGCGAAVARLTAAVQARVPPEPRVCLWPLAGCLLMCVGFVAWVAWYTR